jgi:hypothetical protein
VSFIDVFISFHTLVGFVFCVFEEFVQRDLSSQSELLTVMHSKHSCSLLIPVTLFPFSFLSALFSQTL